MKSIISAGMTALLLLAGPAHAATQTTQQTSTVTCNKQAGAKKGEVRTSFMKHCLASKKSTSSRHHKKTGSKATHTHRKTSATTATAPTAHITPAPATAPAAATTPTEQ